MKASFNKNLAAYRAVQQQNPAPRQIEQLSPTKISGNSDIIRERNDLTNKVTELKNTNSALQNKLAVSENNHKNALSLVSQTQDEVAKLKAENKKLHNIINQQKVQLDAMVQNSQNIESEDKSKVKELEKSLIEKTKDLTIKDGIIQGLQEAVKVISSANASANNSPMPRIKESSLNNSPIKKHDESISTNQLLEHGDRIIKSYPAGNLLDDMLTVKSQVIEDNPQSMLLGEMCDKSTIQVSEEDL